MVGSSSISVAAAQQRGCKPSGLTARQNASLPKGYAEASAGRPLLMYSASQGSLHNTQTEE